MIAKRQEKFMNKLSLFFICFLVIAIGARAGDGDYAVSKIDPSLLKNASVVKRSEEQRFEIGSYSRTVLYKKYALTILNEQGEELAYLYEFYDKLRSIRSIEGRLYNAEGHEIRSLRNKEIEDRSAVSEISLMEDSRVKVHNFYYKIYPYTVEYEVIMEFNNTLMFPHWFPQPFEKYAVEKSTLSIKCPSWFTFRYKSFNYNGDPAISEADNKKTYVWQVSNLRAILKEYAAPDFPYLTTCIFFSPDKFELGNYKGASATWQELGQFQVQLNTGRDILPEEVKQKVHAMVDGVSDKREKIRLLYEYLQKTTRYVSIQLGIGGFQPFAASYVASKSYGDCKALSNYMYALLKEANIRSCYTQIRAGAGKYFFMPDFSTDQFDHIILCVPLEKDTMWLECTDQTLPAGYLGSFTCDRYALAIDENGGKLVHTPAYGMQQNTQSRKINAVLQEEGNLELKAFTRYQALQQDNIHGLINNVSRDRVKEYLHEELDLPTYEINNFDYKENRSSVPSIDESLDILVSNYATITGRRLFIVPNIMTKSYRKLPFDTARKYPLEMTMAYKDVDSVEIEIPKGYSSEAMPQDISIDSEFGRYNCSVRLKDNKLYYNRSIEKYNGNFPAKDYNDLVNFYDAVYKADRNKVVLIKSE
ncbi:MAG: DUF3857 domain-containing protein [Bacteroidetes bacterium]|nr:MAG: DUF3857 domain-containing protein [Bacteroidota bacterium]